MSNSKWPEERVLSVNQIRTAFVSSYREDFYFPGESHEMWELNCVLEGTVGFSSDAEIYECRAGDAVIHPGGVFHTAWAKRSAPIRLLTVSFTGEGLTHQLPRGTYRLGDSALPVVELLDRTLSQQTRDGETAQIVKNLVEVLLLTLLRAERTEAPSTDRQAVLFSSIARYLQRNVDRVLTVQTICNECAIGRTSLKELFRRYTGVGVIQYYHRLRIRKVVALMDEGCSMAEVAQRMHFSSQSYLSAFFRRETGASPLEYRRKQRFDGRL